MKIYKVSYRASDKPDALYHSFQEVGSAQEAEDNVKDQFINSKIRIAIESTVIDYDSTTILDTVSDIIYNRSEEKQRQYGPFEEGMTRAAMIFNGMTGLQLEAEHVYKMLISLKLSRDSYNKKYDNILDTLAYMTQLYEHYKEEYNKTK